MKLRLLVVGRGSRQLADFESRFVERLQAMARFKVLELPEGRGKQISQRKQEEAGHILKQARKGFVLLDEHGQMQSSMEWAGYLRGLHGDAQQDFVIGGADGVSASLKLQAGACWSLSRLTLPHQLARALVLEQLYRALTIIQGHPYHRA